MAEDDVDELAAAILVGLVVNRQMADSVLTPDGLAREAYDIAEAFAELRRLRRRSGP